MDRAASFDWLKLKIDGTGSERMTMLSLDEANSNKRKSLLLSLVIYYKVI